MSAVVVDLAGYVRRKAAMARTRELHGPFDPMTCEILVDERPFAGAPETFARLKGYLDAQRAKAEIAAALPE